MAHLLMIVGLVLAWGALILQVVLLWREGDKSTALLTALFWPAAVVVALFRLRRWWLALAMVGGIGLAWTGSALR